jgi:uncharacterized membrane protein
MGTSPEDQYTFFVISRSVLLRMRNISNINCVETQNTHFTFDNFFFSKIVTFMRSCTAGKATDDNKAHAHCKLDN